MKKNLVLKIFIAFVVGLGVGILLWISDMDVTTYVTWVSPFGSIFVSMLKMIVVPVILLSLIAGAASLPTNEFGKIGIRVIVWYFVTSLLAAVMGSVLAILFNPGGSSSKEAWQTLANTGEASEISNASNSSIIEVFINMFQNPFQALAQGNFPGYHSFCHRFWSCN